MVYETHYTFLKFCTSYTIILTKIISVGDFFHHFHHYQSFSFLYFLVSCGSCNTYSSLLAQLIPELFYIDFRSFLFCTFFLTSLFNLASYCCRSYVFFSCFSRASFHLYFKVCVQLFFLHPFSPHVQTTHLDNYMFSL